MGAGGTKRSENIRKHVLSAIQHLVVPESDDGKPASADPCITLSIQTLAVVPAVKLDDQAAFQARKVKHVRPEWMLTAKSTSRQLSETQVAPEATLRICSVSA
jgi:hypothetical protein